MTVARHHNVLCEASVDILDTLASQGLVTAQVVADDTGRSKPLVTRRLWHLKAQGLVAYQAGAWAITERGRERLRAAGGGA